MGSENSSGCEGSNSCSSGLIKLGSTLIVLIIIVAAIWFWPRWYQNYAPSQPVPFSHKRHSGMFNIPCLYCHGAAEYSAHAEVPGLETCMNCHTVVLPNSPFIQQVKAAFDSKQPIAWKKVHILPDFVNFNHKRHVSAGLACQTCHGPVQEMDVVYQWAPLTMSWCVNCHRNNNFVTDFRVSWSEATKELKEAPQPSAMSKLLSHPDPSNADVSCSTCHY